MITVYRVEHTYTATGPYCMDNSECFTIAEAHRDSQHPTSGIDIPDSSWRLYDVRHGFSSLEMLYTWFDGWEDWLAERGFVISVFEVAPAHVWLGDYQLVYDTAFSQYVEQLDWR